MNGFIFGLNVITIGLFFTITLPIFVLLIIDFIGMLIKDWKRRRDIVKCKMWTSKEIWTSKEV